MKTKFKTVTAYMRNQWITIIVFEVLVLVGKLIWNSEYMKGLAFFRSVDTPSLLIGTELILGFCLWSVGMDFYKKLGEMNSIFPMSGKERRNMLFTYPLVFAAVVAGIETLGNYLLIRNRVAFSPLRLLQFAFGNKTYNREFILAYFVVELLIYYVFVLWGYVWERMIEHFEVSTLIGVHAVLVIVVVFVFRTFIPTDYDTHTIIHEGQRSGYWRAKISALDGDLSKYINFVSREEMNLMLSDVQDGDVHFSFPYKEKEEDYEWGAYLAEKVPGESNYFVSSYCKIYPEREQRIRLGNGMGGNLTIEELQESVAGCKIYTPESPDLLNMLRSVKYSYCIFMDDTGRTVYYGYDSSREKNMMPYIIGICADPTPMYQEIYRRVF